MSIFLQRVRDRNLVNNLSTNIDVSVTRGFTIDTINIKADGQSNYSSLDDVKLIL